MATTTITDQLFETIVRQLAMLDHTADEMVRVGLDLTSLNECMKVSQQQSETGVAGITSGREITTHKGDEVEEPVAPSEAGSSSAPRPMMNPLKSELAGRASLRRISRR